jgi:sporulation protein YlmC with PRC-barrel domain
MKKRAKSGGSFLWEESCEEDWNAVRKYLIFRGLPAFFTIFHPFFTPYFRWKSFNFRHLSKTHGYKRRQQFKCRVENAKIKGGGDTNPDAKPSGSIAQMGTKVRRVAYFRGAVDAGSETGAPTWAGEGSRTIKSKIMIKIKREDEWRELLRTGDKLGLGRVLLAWGVVVFNDWVVSRIGTWPAVWMAMALVSALPGMAAEPEASGRDYATAYPPERLGLLTKASDLIDAPVWDLAGHKLGKIEDFVLDWNSGRVYCVLIAPQHLYGAMDYYIAVPAKSFVSVEVARGAADATRAVVNTNAKTLIGMPRFLRSGWDATAVSNAVAGAYRQFGQPLSWDEKAGPGAVGRYSSLMGVDVNNRANVNIGNLSDLVFDLPTERILFAMVSFYGEDQNEHAVPFPAVSVAPDRQNLILDVDNSKVGGLVNPDDFLTVKMTDPFWVAEAFWSYGKRPGFDTTEWARLTAPPPAAENKIEVPTPPAASTKQLSGDKQLAREVMVAIIAADLSNASPMQNVTIDANDGVVTLRGRVPSETLKSDWEKIAASVNGVNGVKNELEVK